MPGCGSIRTPAPRPDAWPRDRPFAGGNDDRGDAICRSQAVCRGAFWLTIGANGGARRRITDQGGLRRAASRDEYCEQACSLFQVYLMAAPDRFLTPVTVSSREAARRKPPDRLCGALRLHLAPMVNQNAPRQRPGIGKWRLPGHSFRQQTAGRGAKRQAVVLVSEIEPQPGMPGGLFRSPAAYRASRAARPSRVSHR